MADKTQQLLELARERFELTPDAESVLETLVRAFAGGEVADFSADLEQSNDPAHAEQWGEERTLKADWIYWLLTDRGALDLATPKGLSVMGARIEGQLDLSLVTIESLLAFFRCAFTEPLILLHARIRVLSLQGTHVVGLNADGMNVTSNVYLRDGFRAEGEVRLLGATIGGGLICDGSHFSNLGGVALNADGMNVTGGVFLRSVKAKGEVRLLGATIGRSLECDESQFINPDGVALNADGVNVTSYVFLRRGFNAEGQVRLLGATIGGDLECDGSHFSNLGGVALNADGINVTGGVFLRDGFKAEGTVKLFGGTVDNYLILTEIDQPERMTLDLRSATIGTLWDEEKSWPQKDKLHLSGLVYDAIHEDAPRDSTSRLEWLRRQPENPFSPQPYEQLAKVLQASGHDTAAKRVLIGKQRDRRRRGDLSIGGKIWNVMVDALIAHGYRPHQALLYVAGFIILGAFLFGSGYPDVFSPTKSADDGYPAFDAVVYSLDAFIPIVDLHQEGYWLPDARKGEWVAVLGLEGRQGYWLRIYLWVHISFGWILTSLWVAGLTGLVRKG